MVWHVPTILVGEFHGIHGAHVTLVSQFYGFQHFYQQGGGHCVASQRSQLGAFSLMDASAAACGGGVLVGKHVSSGVVNDAMQSTFHSIASRALATDDEKDETLIWEDPNVGSIGSLSFHLQDILARGEKRKFFIAITHPHHDVLLMRWPVAFALLRLMANRWITAAETLCGNEYQTCANLLQLREDASRVLRPVLSLVRLCCHDAEMMLTNTSEVQQPQQQLSHSNPPQKSSSSSDVDPAVLRATLMDFHVFAEVGFVKIIGGASPQRTLTCVRDVVAVHGNELLPPGPAGEELVRTIQRAVDREYCAIVSATQVVTSSKQRCAMVDSPCVAPLSTKRVVVRPLATWLRTMKCAELGSFAFPRKAGRLLRALLTGNQIIITSDTDEVVAADFALSLAQSLPSALRRVCVQSDVYRPGYFANILALSDEFLDVHDVVQHSTFSPDKELLVLSEVTSPGAVHVRLHDTEEQECSFIDVDECSTREDESSSSFGGNNSSLAQRPVAGLNVSPMSGGASGNAKLPGAVLRILDLVNASVLNQHEDRKHDEFEQWCHEVELLQSQIELVVQEFVARGRLYVPRFHSQNTSNNAALLAAPPASGGSPVGKKRAGGGSNSPKPNPSDKQSISQRLRNFWSRGGGSGGAGGVKQSIRYASHLADCVVAGSAAAAGSPSAAAASPAGSLLSFGRSSLVVVAAAAGGGGGGGGDRDGAASAAGSAYYHNAYYGAQHRESNLSTATGGPARYQGGGGSHVDPFVASSAAADVTLDLCAARDVDHEVLMFLGGAHR